VSTAGDDSLDLIHRALAGDRASMDLIVERLYPVIQRQVGATLRKRGPRGRDVRQELNDMAHAVFVSLFVPDGKALRAWDPGRGIPLEKFVSLLARHQVISLMRGGRTTPWRDEPTDPEALDATAVAAGPLPEEIVASRENLRLVLDGLREQLSPAGLEMFYRLVVNEETPEQVSAATGKTLDAVYKWRSRLLQIAREVAQTVSEATGPSRISGGTSRR
jgi:RNA polymerase sigma-70 factor (ECF subfamily)